MNNQTKRCTKCKTSLPLSSFGSNGKTPSGEKAYRASCKTCEKARDKKRSKQKQAQRLRRRLERGEEVSIPVKVIKESNSPNWQLPCKTFNRSEHPLYKTWAGMIQRCHNPNMTHYCNYGGRGIEVCERWRNSFLAFLADMGEKPTPSHSLDRINVNGNYEPSNCRWATPKEQANNMRTNVHVEYQGQLMTVTQLAELVGVPASRLHHRIAREWSVEEAVSIPKGQHRNSQRQRYIETSKALGISESALRTRVAKHGWDSAVNDEHKLGPKVGSTWSWSRKAA